MRLLRHCMSLISVVSTEPEVPHSCSSGASESATCPQRPRNFLPPRPLFVECAAWASDMEPRLVGPLSPECSALEELVDLQWPRRGRGCNRLLIYSFPAGNEGLGSLIHETTSALAEAYHEGRTLVFGPQVAEAQLHPFCGRGIGWECLFEPIGACQVPGDLSKAEQLALAPQGFAKTSSTDIDRVVWYLQERGNPAQYVPPKAYRGIPRARMWWAALLVRFVFRLHEEGWRMARAVTSQQNLRSYLYNDLFWHGSEAPHISENQRLVCVHVRRHLNCNPRYGRGSCHNVSAYAEAARDLLVGDDINGNRKQLAVLLVGADMAVDEIDTFRIALVTDWPVPVFREATPDAMLQNATGSAEDDKRWYQVHLSSDAIGPLLRDILLLSSCAGLVGTRNSHFTQLSNLLRFYKGFRSPALYLDAQQIREGSVNVGWFHNANLRRNGERRFEGSTRRLWYRLHKRDFLASDPSMVEMHLDSLLEAVVVDYDAWDVGVEIWQNGTSQAADVGAESLQVSDSGSLDPNSIKSQAFELLQRCALPCSASETEVQSMLFNMSRIYWLPSTHNQLKEITKNMGKLRELLKRMQKEDGANAS